MLRSPVAHACVLAALAGSAFAQRGISVRAHTDKTGTYLYRTDTPVFRPRSGGGIDSVLWTYPDPVAIPESVAFGPTTNSAYVGQQLNNERFQRFDITGTGTPTYEVAGHHATFNPSCVGAAGNADLAVYLDQIAMNGAFIVTAFRASSAEPLWVYNVPEDFNSSDIWNARVSRDGSTVAIVVSGPPTTNPNANTAAIFFLNGVDGTLRSAWTDPNGACEGVDMTDDGSVAITCQGAPPAGIGQLINTSNGSVIRTFAGNGAGGRYEISGDGNVVVIGGFDFRVFVKSAGVYTQRITFSASGSWFSWGADVSRDGSTVGALSHNYLASYLNTDVRIWDVASGNLLGTASTVGSGTLQDSAWDGVMSDNGSRFAVESWGDAVNTHPEVRVFDRNVNLIGSIDTAGSPFSLDLSPDGQYTIAGNKSVHANVFGNGGMVTLLQIPVAGGGCYANCDNSTTAPILNVLDFTCFLNRFAAGDTYANCDHSTTPPVLNVLDFQCFLNAFAAGCT
jgi:hypothetical protein